MRGHFTCVASFIIVALLVPHGARASTYPGTSLEGDLAFLDTLPQGVAAELVWPVSGSSAPDLPQSNAFGPRLLAGDYNFHRGIDIEVTPGTPIYASFSGSVHRAGDYPGVFRERVVQIKKFFSFDDGDGGTVSRSLYTVCTPMLDVSVDEDDEVTQGQLLGHANSTSLHFELRYGGGWASNAINPWHLLPYEDTAQHDVEVAWVSCDDGEGTSCTVAVDVECAKDELDVNAVSAGFVDAAGDAIAASTVDFNFEINNYATDSGSASQLDDPDWQLGVHVQPFAFNDFSVLRWRFVFELQQPGSFASVAAYATDLSGSVASDVWDGPLVLSAPFETTEEVGDRAYLDTIPRASASTFAWPLSGTSAPDLPQSSPFGPRLKASEGLRYDFHRGIDLPTPIGTPAYAIADGVVERAGFYPGVYDDLVVQVRTALLFEDGDGTATLREVYATYLHMLDNTVHVGDAVERGDLIGHTNASLTEDAFEHLHFEIRYGGSRQSNCINPWHLLPYDDGSSHSVEVLSVGCGGDGKASTCTATVLAAAPRDELDLNSIAAGFVDDAGDEVPGYPRIVWDFERNNLAHGDDDPEALDSGEWQPGAAVEPWQFSSRDDPAFDTAKWTVAFTLQRPPGTVYAAAWAVDLGGHEEVDVWSGDFVLSDGEPADTAFTGDRAYLDTLPRASMSSFVWPLSATSVPDLPQSDAYGPRLVGGEYDFHRGVDIPAASGTAFHAAFAGVVHRAGDYPDVFADRVVQVKTEYVFEGTDGSTTSRTLYATYTPALDVSVEEGDEVALGQQIGHTGATSSGSEYLHFELRYGGGWQSNAINPWHLMPYTDTDRHSVEVVDVQCTDGEAAGTCVVIVEADAPKDELDLNTVEAAFVNATGNPVTGDPGIAWDFEANNYATDGGDADSLDDPGWQAGVFVQPYEFGAFDTARWRFTFELERPCGATGVAARAFDVAGNMQASQWGLPTVQCDTPREGSGSTGSSPSDSSVRDDDGSAAADDEAASTSASSDAYGSGYASRETDDVAVGGSGSRPDGEGDSFDDDGETDDGEDATDGDGERGIISGVAGPQSLVLAAAAVATGVAAAARG